MSNTASLKKEYQDRIVPALTKEFGYKTVMQVPVLKKIVINQGLGMAAADKKIIDIAISELSAITGQKAVATVSKKDISNFKLRKKMPIGVMVTLRREQMYEFLERLVRVALPRIRDFKGIESKLDGRGNAGGGQRAQDVVGLPAFGGDDAVAQVREDLLQHRHLLGQLVRHAVAGGLVALVHLVAEGGGLQVKGHSHFVGLGLLQQGEHDIQKAENGVGITAVLGGQQLDAEKGTVGDAVAVNDQ